MDNPPVVLETGSAPVGSVIWLHGLGADGHDFEALVPELGLPPDLPLRFVFPHAPVRPVTVNGGLAMRAWYDIVSLDFEGRADAAGVRDSSALLDDLVRAELDAGTSADHIVLAGFSQGGAIVLHNALSRPRPLAGVIALSTYLALPGQAVTAPEPAPFRVFMAHGTQDGMVPYVAGRQSADRVQSLGYPVDWHEYPMAHGVCPAEIRDLRTWLLRAYGRSQPET